MLDLEISYEEALRKHLAAKGLALHIDRLEIGGRTYHTADVFEAAPLRINGQTQPKRIYEWGMGSDPRGALEDVMRRLGWTFTEVA